MSRRAVRSPSLDDSDRPEAGPSPPAGGSALRRVQAWARDTPGRAALPRWLDVVVFVAVAVVGALAQWHLTRGLTLHYDEYAWAFRYRDLGSGVLTLWGGWFDPLARFAYNLAFSVVGIDDYRPFRAMAVGANLLLAAAMWLYARSIGHRWLGLAAAMLPLVLGSGSPSVLLPLNSMNAVGLAALPASLALLRRRRPMADLGALMALCVAMGFAGPVVLPVCAAVAVWVCLARPFRPARLLVPGIPVVIYAVAFATLPGPAGTPAAYLDNLQIAPLYISDLASTGAAGLLGVGAATGPSILAALVVAACIGVPRLPPEARARVIAVVVALVGAWVMIALGRAAFGDAAAPRYVVLTVVPVLLAAVDLAGYGLTATRAVALAGVVAFALVGNLTLLREAAAFLRNQAEVERAELAALELGLHRAPPGYRPDTRREWPLIFVTAQQWRAATARLGSPAPPSSALPAASAEGREQADRILRELGGVERRPLGDGLREPTGSPVCLRSAGEALALPLEAGGLAVAATGTGPVEVRLRRFADAVPQDPWWVVDPGTAALLVPAPDASPATWTAELRGAPVLACPSAAASP